jgi:hypothetical protein
VELVLIVIMDKTPFNHNGNISSNLILDTFKLQRKNIMGDEDEDERNEYSTLDFVGDVLNTVAEVMVIEAVAEVLVATASVAGEVACSVIEGIVNSDS